MAENGCDEGNDSCASTTNEHLEAAQLGHHPKLSQPNYLSENVDGGIADDRYNISAPNGGLPEGPGEPRIFDIHDTKIVSSGIETGIQGDSEGEREKNRNRPVAASQDCAIEDERARGGVPGLHGVPEGCHAGSGDERVPKIAEEPEHIAGKISTQEIHPTKCGLAEHQRQPGHNGLGGSGRPDRTDGRGPRAPQCPAPNRMPATTDRMVPGAKVVNHGQGLGARQVEVYNLTPPDKRSSGRDIGLPQRRTPGPEPAKQCTGTAVDARLGKVRQSICAGSRVHGFYTQSGGSQGQKGGRVHQVLPSHTETDQGTFPLESGTTPLQYGPGTGQELFACNTGLLRPQQHQSDNQVPGTKLGGPSGPYADGGRIRNRPAARKPRSLQNWESSQIGKMGPRRFGPSFPSQLVAEKPHSQIVRDYRRLDEQSAQDVLIAYEIDKSVSSADIQITSPIFLFSIQSTEV